MKTLIRILMWIPFIGFIVGLWNMYNYEKIAYDWFDNKWWFITLNMIWQGSAIVAGFIILNYTW